MELGLKLPKVASGTPCGAEPILAGQVNAYLGATEQALACLEAEAKVGGGLWYLSVEPLFKQYLEHPRFVAMLEREDTP